MPHYIAQVEIESLNDWDFWTAKTTDANGWIIQNIDLHDRGDQLDSLDLNGALFLGCTLPQDHRLEEQGAIIFPKVPGLPFNPYRSTLYSPLDLYDAIAKGQLYSQTTDALVYAWMRALPKPIWQRATLAMALHDHAISEALEDFCADFDPRLTVGIMGGHVVSRDSDEYIGAARLASRLAANRRVIFSGGGPGAMEAANLGAFLAGQPAALRDALSQLSQAPSYQEDATFWAATALEIRQTMRATGISVGVPTWYYGHEPANVFGTKIAKYFSNATREDTLLARCKGGIVYLPGAAGTVQELFQATTTNYYACDLSLISPTVLVGKDYWTNHFPAWQLLDALASTSKMASKVFLVDDVDEAADLLLKD